MGERIVEQGPRRGYGRGAQNPTFVVDAMVMQTTKAKAEVILQQLNELTHNPQYGPVYVTWDEVNANGYYQDGWYDFEGCRPDYSLIFGGKVKVQLSFRRHAETTRQRVIGWRDASQTSALAAAGATAIGLPQSSVVTGLNSISRVAAEGSSATVIPGVAANGFLSVLNSPPVFTYRTRCYDRNGANAVPATGFTNANWIEVYGPDHNFQGDVILTNGLLLLHFQLGTAIQAYVWNQYAGSPGWTLFGQVALQGDSTISNRNLVVQQAHLQRLISEEGRVVATVTDSTAGWSGTLDFRLQRNMRFADVQAMLLQGSGNAGLALVALPNALKAALDDLGGADVTLTTPAESALASAGQYGLMSGISSVAANLWIPAIYTVAGTGYTATSTTQMLAPQSAVNVLQRAAVAAVPWSVSPVNLYLEAETATVVGTTTTATDAAASPQGGTNNVLRVQGNVASSGFSFTETGRGLASGYKYLPIIRARCSVANASAKIKTVSNVTNHTVVPNAFTWGYNNQGSFAATTSTGSQTDTVTLEEEIYLTTIASPHSSYSFTKPVHYYRLGEASGTTATDAMGNGNGTYTASGVTYSVTGPSQLIDKAVTFASASSAKVGAIPITNLSTGAGRWSLEAWVNLAAFAQGIAVSYGDANIAHGCPQLGVDGTGHPYISDQTTSLFATVAVTTAAWHQIVATYDGTSMFLYVDGAAASPASTTAALAIPTTASTGRIGCKNSNGTDQLFFNGSIDEVCFYNYTLTLAQITAHWNVGQAAAFCHFDEVAILPLTQTNDGPADNWQQWLADRLARYPAFR